MSRSRGGRRHPVARFDQRVFDRVSRSRSPGLDTVLPPLTRAADKSRLWVAIAVGLGATRDRRLRRAAVRGLASVAVSSALVNQLGKRVFPRRRPDLRGVPTQRIASRVPVSSSFPSGHSASAAAFAVGVGIEAPLLAAPVAAVAAAVGFSRVYTGVHYPGDVLAGAALGAGIAAAGAWWVPRPTPPEPPAPSTRVTLRPRRLGSGVHIVVNPRSGVGARDQRQFETRLHRSLPEAVIRVLAEDEDLLEVLRTEAEGALALGIAGGDGSVNAAAAVAMEHDLPLLVVPRGTLNHFARDLGLDTVGDAVEAVVRGEATAVDVGEVAGDIFLNTASLGSYPSFVAVREKWQDKLGKPLAALIAADRVLRGEDALPARVDGHRRALAALFVGAGRYRPTGIVPSRRPRLDSGVLDVRYLDIGGRSWRLLTFIQLLARRDLHPGAFVHAEERELHLHVEGHTMLARDGEIGPVAGPDVRFRVRPRALTVYRTWEG
ncbi:diacylglycerol kinase family protein [Jatrophihabitans sp. YIM 134969]